MRQMIESFVVNMLVRNSKEEFSVNSVNGLHQFSKYQLIAHAISLIVVNLLILLAGKYLWNNFSVKAVSGINKVSSIWELLAISILLKLLF